MIPKIIHYCWFGRKPKPKSVLAYIDTWKKYLPDFEIKEWNEDNYDVNMMKYTKEAYFAKKYAFVSDVVRLYALVNEGGIYLDTDIRIVKRFSEELLHSHGFLGFEHNVYVTTGVMACEPNNILLKDFFYTYKARSFFKTFSFDLRTNVLYLTDFMKQRGLKCDNKMQKFEDLILLPQEYLCANDFETQTFYNNEKTYTIHEFSYSWGNEKKIARHFKEINTIIKYKILNLWF